MSIRLIVAQKTNPRPLLAGHECFWLPMRISPAVYSIFPEDVTFLEEDGVFRSYVILIISRAWSLYASCLLVYIVTQLQGKELDTPTNLVNDYTI